jgi:hypothetical protein
VVDRRQVQRGADPGRRQRRGEPLDQVDRRLGEPVEQLLGRAFHEAAQPFGVRGGELPDGGLAHPRVPGRVHGEDEVRVQRHLARRGVVGVGRRRGAEPRVREYHAHFPVAAHPPAGSTIRQVKPLDAVRRRVLLGHGRRLSRSPSGTGSP